MIKRACETCDFWVRINGKGGTCRRYPPNATPKAGQVPGNIVKGLRPSPINFFDVISWPKTRNEDWCGEWKENEQ